MKNLNFAQVVFFSWFLASSCVAAVKIDPRDILPNTVDSTEFGSLDGARSNLQAQIDSLCTSVSNEMRLTGFGYDRTTLFGTNLIWYIIAGGIPADEEWALLKLFARTSQGTAAVQVCYIVTNGSFSVVVTNGSVNATTTGAYTTSFASNTIPAGAMLFYQLIGYDPTFFPTQAVYTGVKYTF